jgi:F1F0 ATPase subunit 2
VTVTEIGSLSAALGLGLILGWFFFGGLWWTLQRLPTSRNPTLLALGSLVTRTAVTVLGFYWVAAGDWRRIAAAVVGFLIVRQLLIRRIRPQPRPVTPGKGQGE